LVLVSVNNAAEEQHLQPKRQHRAKSLLLHRGSWPKLLRRRGCNLQHAKNAAGWKRSFLLPATSRASSSDESAVAMLPEEAAPQFPTGARDGTSNPSGRIVFC